MEAFKTFLEKKKIDWKLFRLGEPGRFEEWGRLYSQVSEPSFVAQKLFLINPLRRKYKLEIAEENKEAAQSGVKKSRPAFKKAKPQNKTQSEEK